MYNSGEALFFPGTQKGDSRYGEQRLHARELL